MQSGYNINDLVEEAQTRWLKPAEVLFILQNYKEDQLTHDPPQKPSSGSLFLFNKRVLRFFRRDGHSWRRKKDGRSVGEAHERLKVGNVEALNCYYAHGEQNPKFQRRSYWMLDLAYEHIVLVHYRDITKLQGRNSSGSFSKLLRVSPSALSQSPSSYTAQHPGSTAVISELNEPCQNLSSPGSQNLSSPGSVEGSSDVAIKSNMINRLDSLERTGEISSSSENQALQMLEELLSLNDDSLEEIIPLSDNENPNSSQNIVDGQSYGGSAEMQAESINLGLPLDTGDNGKLYHQSLGHEFAVDSEETFSWKEMLEFYKSLPDVESQEKNVFTSDGNGMLLPTSYSGPLEEHEGCQELNFGGSNAISPLALLPIEIENLRFPVYNPTIDDHDTNPEYYTTLFEECHPGMPLEANSSLTIAQKQKFTIREISPEWGYDSEATKVLIIGSFLCGPSECEWTCMFGDIEVPLLILQEGVICCQAPPHLPGKVTLCVTSGNRESCSEVRDFEYRVKPISSAHCSSSPTEETKTREELSLLVRFVHMLLSETLIQKVDNSGSGIDWLSKCKAGEDSWSRVLDDLSVDTWTSFGTTDWLLQELLKDKLQQWLSSRSSEGHELGYSWSKNEQGIIHMVAGLGFEWALSAILSSGVGINFRDINGWTALHWAAHFGREKMVAALIASGASAGALTDPTSQDPTGQTAASIAATSGYKGLAGYLSEVALTSHLSSLTLEESELSKNSADVEAEITVNNISKRSLEASEDDQLSLKDTLAAVRNAAQAAARIQSAFRAHSFRKRKQQEAAAAAGADKYDVLSNDVQGLLAASKLASRNVRDYNSAALTIQKKYRGWKGRKNFLAFRQKVVMIQAHVRGHQVRKYYKVICWAVSVLEKVVLRWRRRGVGLRGYRPESESIDESEDEDILKLFRKQKVDAAVEKAVSRVLSMVKSPDARQQYRRMLERYRLAKAGLGLGGGGGVGVGVGVAAEGLPSTSQADDYNMDNDSTYNFP